MSEPPKKNFSTRAVHAGERVSPGGYTPVITPIHPSVGYLYETMAEVDAVFAGTAQGYVYPRYGSPTVTAFEAAIADLEEGEAAHAFASGMAAMHNALLAAGARAGTSIVAALDLYGATFSLVRGLMHELGVQFRLVDICDLESVEKAIRETRPVAVLAETISNPLMKVADIPRLTTLAHSYQAQILVDNTFASPYLYTPATNGADFIIHSATKYLAGHGDVLAGVVISSQANRDKMYEINKLVGGVLGPFEAWLALRGLKTLPLRLRQQCENAQKIAEWLEAHPKIGRVNYPGLPGHPQHTLARSLFADKGFGGMLSFEIASAGRAEVFRFMENLKLCLPATTLGDIYSLVLHPATSSHRGLTEAERLQVGIPEGLVRLSAGIESVEDILQDLEQALGVISPGP